MNAMCLLGLLPLSHATIFDQVWVFEISELKMFSYLVMDSSISFMQVSFDVAWSPDCIDGRCYDAEALSKVVDFLVVMAYDEQSQIKTADCVAKANSPLKQTKAGNNVNLFSIQFLPTFSFEYYITLRLLTESTTQIYQ